MKKTILTISSVILILMTVVVGAVTVTGADNSEASEGSFSSSKIETVPADLTIEKTVQEVPVKVFKAVTKDDYLKKILNSVDYYNVVNGTIETNMLNGYDYSIEYNVDMSDCRAYQRVVGEKMDEEVFVQDNKIYTIDNINKTRNNCPKVAYAKSDEIEEESVSLGDVSVDDRITYTTKEDIEAVGKEAFSTSTEASAKKIPVYHYRLNPTNVHYASTVSLFAQEMAFGFLSNKDLWDITDKTVFLDRECTVVEGTTEKSYGAKLNVSSFVMIIDNESGIILSFEGYDSNGERTQYSITKSVSFNEEKIKTFDLSNYQNYRTE